MPIFRTIKQNWAKTEKCNPKRVIYPKSEEEIISLIKEANRTKEKKSSSWTKFKSYFIASFRRSLVPKINRLMSCILIIKFYLTSLFRQYLVL